MNIHANVHFGYGFGGSCMYLRLAFLLLIACGNVGSAEARDAIRYVNLGGDRNLVARETREGVALHFMGKVTSPDDRVVLLPNRRYIADVFWLAGSGTVVVAIGPGEAPVDVYGFDRDGRRLYRRRSHQEFAERLNALPGDSLVVVSSLSLDMPMEMLNAGTGELTGEYLTWPSDRIDFRGRDFLRLGFFRVLDSGLMLMVDRREPQAMVSIQEIGAEMPLWVQRSTTGFAPTVLALAEVALLDSTLSQSAPKEMALPIAGGSDWTFLDAASSERRILFAGRSDGEAVVVSFDRENGEVVAATRLPGQYVTLVAEPRGDRLLAIVEDRRNRGHLLVLDQSTLECREAIANPGGLYFPAFFPPRILSTDDGSICLVPFRIFGPGSDKDGPRSLCVTWGEEVGIHWLDAPADLTDDGRILVAKEHWYEGHEHVFRIEEWRP